MTYGPIVQKPEADLASRIVWFDACVTNVDRTPRNTNMLMWHKRLWLIDHGATLYFHRSPGWEADPARARDPFPLIRTHVLINRAQALESVDDRMARALSPDVIGGIVDAIPGGWLTVEPGHNAATLRAAYARYFLERVTAPRPFVEEALRAR